MSRRWTFRLSLRTLCLLVLVLCVLCALLSAPIRRAERQRRVLAAVHGLGGNVWFADERVPDGYSRVLPEGYLDHLEAPVWQFRDGYVRQIEDVTIWSDDVADDLIREIGLLPKLRGLTVTPIVDRTPAMQRLRTLRPDVQVHVCWLPRHVPFQQLTSSAELRKAAANGNSILFTDGSWSSEFQQFRPKLAAFYEKWQRENPAAVNWLRADLSDANSQSADEFRNWLSSEGLDIGGLKRMGAGYVIWLQAGRIRDAAWCDFITGEEELEARTRKAFERNPEE